MVLWRSRNTVAALGTILSLAGGPLAAGQVTLNALDGTVSMTGELLGYDGTTYTLHMLVGDISIDASRVVCAGAACPNLAADRTDFTIAGAGEVGKVLMPALIEMFARHRGGDIVVKANADGSRNFDVLDPDGTVHAKITLQPAHTHDGLTGLMEGSADIAMAARRADAKEIAAFDLSGKGRIDSPGQERILALDAVIVVVNPDNPVKVLSLAQAGDIFSGKITNWQQLGGRDAPIVIYRQGESADTVAAFSAMAQSGQALAPVPTVLASETEVSDAVRADKNGIGITRYAEARNAVPVTLRSVCGELFTPAPFAIKTESYPLTQRLYLYTANSGLPDVANEFLDFVASPVAQSAVRDAGFVDQSVARVDLDAQGRRLAQAIVSASGRAELLKLQDLSSVMLDAVRLSFTLHYDETGALDARALDDIQRLAALIRSGAFASRQMLVLGFSDNAGGANAQLLSSQSVAQNVRDQIVAATGRAKLGDLRISPFGYGPLMPPGCNETATGRRSNNRVEIWIK
jgi:phosphate transport system substrate-binding protein